MGVLSFKSSRSSKAEPILGKDEALWYGNAMNATELAWLAGILEGEGSFMKGPPSSPDQPLITVQMTDEDVVQKVASMFGTSIVRNKVKKQEWKPTFSARIRGSRAVLLMKELRPLMGLRRTKQIDRATASYKSNSQTLLNLEKATDIRRRAVSGEPMSELAAEFGVSYCTIKKIKYGETWKSAV